MSFLDRRTFLKAVGSIPLAVWLKRDALAQTSPFVRYNVLSEQGQAMLKIYEQGVARMKALFESDPLSWTFQWYIHAVRNDRTKATELSRIYPVPGPERTLASVVWSTCQPHFNSANRPFFLPWHRMYLLRFERIIRKLTSQPQFTFPYWNYSASGPTHGILPAAFRVSTSPLFVQNRRSSVNAGLPIDASSPGALATTALNQCSYNPQGVLQGFCQALDSGLHGNVHVLIGDRNNMGSVPWAARDPIFWLHHCYIDRLWASWNRAGRSNPSSTAFLNTTFTFADENGQQVVGKVGDVLSISRLGYAYSNYASVPSCPQTSSTALAESELRTALEESEPYTAQEEPELRTTQEESAPHTAQEESMQEATRALAAAGPVPLASEPVWVQLQMLEAPTATRETTFDMRIRKLPSSTRIYLVMSKLQAAEQPAVLYDVYFAPSKEAAAKPPARRRVGTINFFNAVSHGEHAQSLVNDDRFVSFEVTDRVRRLQLEGLLKEELSVAIVPAGEPAADAKPVIGSIELALQ
jgi:tyrosinase